MPVADYTKKAVKNYQSKFDLVQVRFPKGTKDKIISTGQKPNDYIVRAVLAALETAEQEQGITAGREEMHQISAENAQGENLTPTGEEPKNADDSDAWAKLEELRKKKIEEAERVEKALKVAESLIAGEDTAEDEEKERERRAQISEQRFFSGEEAN